MRTTLTLDEDLFELVKNLAKRLGKPFKMTLNETLRAGVRHVSKSNESKTYRTKSHAMGLKSGFNLDNIQEVLSQIEGESGK